MVKIPKGISPMTSKEALKSLKGEFLTPEEIRMHQALDSISETLKDVKLKLRKKEEAMINNKK